MSDLQSRAFLKKNGALYPSDVFAQEFFDRLKDGAEILLSVRKPRSVKNHRLLFALLRITVENTDKWADEEVLLDDLKLATGLFQTRVSALTGMPYPVPASISFASMDQARFSAWFPKAVAVCADVLDCTPEELLGEVEGGTREIRRRAA
jgi:hypothetical protein